MAAAIPTAALNEYTTSLRRAVGVVSSTAMLLTDCRDPADGLEHEFTLARKPPLLLRNTRGDLRYHILIRQKFRVVADGSDRRPQWQVRITGYQYMVADPDDREILSYHLHPGQALSDAPHLHLKGHPLRELQKAHLPTSHVTLESFIRFLIRDLQVHVTTRDYRRILDDCEQQSAQAY